MAEYVDTASKTLKIAEKIVEIIKAENLSEEEAMTVLNLIDIALFPEEFNEEAMEIDLLSSTCPCTVLENLLLFDICDGDCEHCQMLTDSDDFEGCQGGCEECGGCHDSCEHKTNKEECGACNGCDNGCKNENE